MGKGKFFRKIFKSKLLILVLSLVILESVGKTFLFYYQAWVSYGQNRKYYRFDGSFLKYIEAYKAFNRDYKTENKVIVNDIFNRHFYVPNRKLKFGESGINTNSLGMKGEEISVLKDARTFRIICLGCSTVLCGSEGNSFPELLEKYLRELYPHKKFEVINAAISGQTTLGAFMNMSLNWKELKPDMLIINSVFEEVTNSVAPYYFKSYLKNDRDTAIWDDFKEKISRKSGIVGLCRKLFFKPSKRLTQGTQEGLDYYAAILEALVLLGKGMESKVVLVSSGIAVDESNNFEKDNPKRRWLEAHFPQFTGEAILQIISDLNLTMQEVAAKQKVKFVDMSAAVPKDQEHFLDGAHRTDKGNAVFAKMLLESLVADKLLE